MKTVVLGAQSTHLGRVGEGRTSETQGDWVSPEPDQHGEVTSLGYLAAMGLCQVPGRLPVCRESMEDPGLQAQLPTLWQPLAPPSVSSSVK